MTAIFAMTVSDPKYHSSIVSFLNAIFRTVVQKLTRNQLIRSVARSLCDS